MHALEAAAMDDPFLADALEGYNAVKPATIPADVDELRARLNERSRDRKVVPLPRNNKWWRVAALLIFLGGASMLAYKLLLQDGQNKLATQEKTALNKDSDTAPVLQRDTLTAAATTGSANKRMTLHDSTLKAEAAKQFYTKSAEEKFAPQTFEADKPGVNQQGNASAITKATAPAPVPDLSAYKKPDSLRDDAIAAIKDQAAKDSVFVAGNDANRDARLQNRVSGITTQNQQANNRANSEANNQLYFNNFNGRVVDAQNNAIPYASVRINNNNQVAATNNDGVFQIKSADTVLDLSVSSVGYQPRNFSLRSNQPTQDVELERNSSGKDKMSEVVVTGASRKRSAKESNEGASFRFGQPAQDAEPVNGWDEYNKYLQSARRVDDANKGLKGEVIVTFMVNKNGQLSGFSVEQPLSKWHDAEALRLVREGPAWKTLKGKKTRARVIVGF